MNFYKKIVTIVFVACFFFVHAKERYIKSVVSSGVVSANEMLMAAAYDGNKVDASKLQTKDFWDNTLQWNITTSGDKGFPWLQKNSTYIPTQRTGQEEYIPGSVEIAIGSKVELITLLGAYKPYKLKLTGDIYFGGDTLYSLCGFKSVDGQGFAIQNFVLAKHPNIDQVGVFSSIMDSICNLTLEIASIANTTYSQLGVLIGYLPSGAKITNCHVKGYNGNTVVVTGVDSVGGLVGYSEGTITGCTVKNIDVVGSSDYVGGLVGRATGTISGCKISDGSVASGKYAGGMAGYATNTNFINDTIYDMRISGVTVGGVVGCGDDANVTIKNSKAKHIRVSGTGYGVGGIAGKTIGSTYGCSVDSSTIEATWNNGRYAGGIVGHAADESAGLSTIVRCSVDSVRVKVLQLYAGGIVAWTASKVDSCTASRINIDAPNYDVTWDDNSAGGLVGYTKADVTNSKVSNAIVYSYVKAGGLVGSSADGNIENCNVNYAIVYGNAGNAGGLVGYSDATLNNDTVRHAYVRTIGQIGGLTAYASKAIRNCRVDSSTIKNELLNNAGGFVGYLNGSIENCDFDSLYVEAYGSFAGGIVGYVAKGKALSGITLKNKVLTVKSTSYAGAIAGGNAGTISDCHVENLGVSGEVYIGGIVGQNDSIVTGCSVRDMQITSENSFAGGIAGEVRNNGKITNSLVYNTTVTVSPTSGNYAGGLVGHFTGLELSGDTVRQTRVYAEFMSAGGITAYMKNSSGSISNCVIDSSTVNCKANGGGVVGYLDLGTVTGCKVDSVGITVTGTDAEKGGGIAGTSVGNITSCSLSRIVFDVPKYLGGAVGVNSGTVTNVRVDSFILSASEYVGGIAGYSSGNITTCSVDTSEITATARYAGGITGYLTGATIDDCHVTKGKITAPNTGGGIAGGCYNASLISNSDVNYSYIEATQNSDGSCGGFTAVLDTSRISGGGIENSEVKGYLNIGGLAGYGRQSQIQFAYVDSVKITAKYAVAGGVIGHNLENAKVNNCNGIKKVTVTVETEKGGGIAGTNFGTIDQCTVDSSTIYVKGKYAGGIAGINDVLSSKVTKSNVKNSKIESNNWHVGGVVGYTKGEISECNARYDTILGANYVGGIVGSTENSSSASLNLNNVAHSTITSSDGAGGLTAFLGTGLSATNCKVDSSYIKGKNVIGGLVGNNFNATISDCSVDSVRVTATDSKVGGIAGNNETQTSIIKLCTATNIIVTNGDSENVGGIVGRTQGPVDDCTVNGAIISTSSENVGGIAGYCNDTITKATVTDLKIDNGNSEYVGGIAGKIENGAVYDSKVRDARIKVLNIAGGIAGACYSGTWLNDSKVAKSRIEVTATNASCAGFTSILDNSTANGGGVDSSTIKGYTNIGGLVGNNASGTIQFTYVDSVSVTSAGNNAGGICGFSSGTITNCTTRTSSTITSEAEKAGGIAAVSGGNITSCAVSDATITTALLGVGGIAGENKSGYSITSCTVSNATIKAENKGGAGGIAGYNNGAITEGSVVGGSVTGHYTSDGGNGVGGVAGAVQNVTGNISKTIVSGTKVYATGNAYNNIGCGGIVGSISQGVNIEQCAVKGNAYIEGLQYAGGIVGVISSNSASVTNCHAHQSVIYSSRVNEEAFQGGIVGYTNSNIQKCLATNIVIRNYSTVNNVTYLGGIVGRAGAGTISNNVAMVDYFDVRAQYTKRGGHFGRVVANRNNGTFSDNFGWVETYVKYYHKRFGISWQYNVYRSTGNAGGSGLKTDGLNLYVGTEYSNNISYCSKDPIFWTGNGFATATWNSSDANSKYFPKLVAFQSENFSTLVANRGNEIQEKIKNDYSATPDVKIFSPSYFLYTTDNLAVGSSQSVNLYTDLLFDEEDGFGNSVYWSVDLNNNASGTNSTVLFNYTGNSTTQQQFNGNGYSIDGIVRDAFINIANGLFYATNANLKVSRLEVANYTVDYSIGYTTNQYGSILCDYRDRTSDWLDFEDIYINSPSVSYGFSSDPDGVATNGGVADKQHMAGPVAGRGYNVNVNRLALYIPNGSKFRSDFSQVGGLIGNGYNNTFNNIAIYLYNQHLVSLTTADVIDKHYSVGYLIGNTQLWQYGANGTTNIGNIAIAAENGNDVGYSRPYCYPPDISSLSSTVGDTWYNYGSFENALAGAKLTDYTGTWHIPTSNFSADSVYLVRSEYNW